MWWYSSLVAKEILSDQDVLIINTINMINKDSENLRGIFVLYIEAKNDNRLFSISDYESILRKWKMLDSILMAVQSEKQSKQKAINEETAWDLSQPRILPWVAVASWAYRTGISFDPAKDDWDESKIVIIKREDLKYPRWEIPHICWWITKDWQQFWTTDEFGNPIDWVVYCTGKRRCGKSTRAVRRSNLTWEIIICWSMWRIRELELLAKELHLEIPKPICFSSKDQIKHKIMWSKNRHRFIIDDAERILQKLLWVEIDSITFTCK